MCSEECCSGCSMSSALPMLLSASVTLRHSDPVSQLMKVLTQKINIHFNFHDLSCKGCLTHRDYIQNLAISVASFFLGQNFSNFELALSTFSGGDMMSRVRGSSEAKIG